MNLNRFLTVALARPLRLLAASFTLVACSGGDSTGPGGGTPPPPPAPPSPPAAITSVSISPEASSLFTGLSVVLTATARDASGNTVSSATFAWTSSDATIATVDENGVVSGVGAGEATITATSGGLSAAAPVRVNPSLSENVQVSSESASLPHQEEPYIVVDAQGGLFAGWKDMCCSGGVDLVGFARSDDGGRSWFQGGSMALRVQTRFQGDPWLAVDGLGRVYYSRVETDLNLGGGDAIIVSRSDDGGLSWGPLIDAHSAGGAADRQSMVSDGNGTLYLTYARWPNSCCEEDADVIVKLSFDGGLTWSTPTVLGSGPFVGAGVIAAQPTGTAVVVWVRPLGSPPFPRFNVMSSSTFDRGVTWSPAIILSGSVSNLDGRRDATPQVASDPQGRIYATWIESGTNTVVSRSDDGGLTWSQPVVVNDVIQGFRWQPAVALGTDGVVHATWYDSRTGNVNVVYASSSDGGQTWSENVRVTTMQTPATMDGRTTRLGDYMGLAALPDGTAYAVWTDRRRGDQDIFGARIP